MPEKLKILELEKKCGFKWERGISRTWKQGSSDFFPVKGFLDDIESLKQKFVHVATSQLRCSAEFTQLWEQLFMTYGPQLWPSPPIDTSAWLVDPEVNDWEGLYPRTLYYDQANDREK